MDEMLPSRVVSHSWWKIVPTSVLVPPVGQSRDRWGEACYWHLSRPMSYLQGLAED
jgi:hypothetical protein